MKVVTIAETKENFGTMFESLPKADQHAVCINDAEGRPAALLISTDGLMKLFTKAVAKLPEKSVKALSQPMDVEAYEAFRRSMLGEIDPMLELDALFKHDEGPDPLEKIDKLFNHQDDDLEALEEVFRKGNTAH